MISNRKKILCACVALAFSSVVMADNNANNPQPAPAKGKFLLPIMVTALSSGIGYGVTTGVTGFVGSLFTKLQNLLFSEPARNQPEGNQFSQSPSNVQEPTNTTHSVQTNNTVLNSSGLEVKPAVAYKIEQLDPNTYQSIQTFENVGSNPPTLQTGQVFAIIYETTMPGQVRLENIDSQNVTSQIGTYNVVGKKPRRLPATKGFQLSGAAGMEQINIYFTPCRPPEAQDQPGVKEYQALPLCSNTQVTNLAKAGKAGGIKPKSVINQDSPDPSMAVGIATEYTQEDLQNGVPVMEKIRVNHQEGGL
jgi:hypothetical protein